MIAKEIPLKSRPQIIMTNHLYLLKGVPPIINKIVDEAIECFPECSDFYAIKGMIPLYSNISYQKNACTDVQMHKVLLEIEKFSVKAVELDPTCLGSANIYFEHLIFASELDKALELAEKFYSDPERRVLFLFSTFTTLKLLDYKRSTIPVFLNI